ncbi:MAG: hypothetical protein SOW39_03070 [Porphyromonas sp.]|nr:hypothetical protein [Porphyromonas sp.]
MGYLCVMSIVTPENFKKVQAQKEAVIEKRLKDIATYEIAYREANGKFATADELVEFLTNGKIFYVKAEGDYTDAMREQGLTEKQAAAQGLIKRDTTYMSARDSLLKNGEDPRELIMVPGCPGQRIEIETAMVQQEVGNDTINVSVFQAQVPMTVYLAGMDKHILENKISDAKARNNGAGYPGLRIGSLEEVKTTGNWE